jgi:hypothetical protein
MNIGVPILPDSTGPAYTLSRFRMEKTCTRSGIADTASRIARPARRVYTSRRRRP